MARAELVIKLRVLAVAGTGECSVCGTLVSWKDTGPLEELDERVRAKRCPTCKGSLQLHEGMSLELETAAGGRVTREVIAIE
jgi:Zn finger protein HypA/HybF involved in hydrogenase expression